MSVVEACLHVPSPSPCSSPSPSKFIIVSMETDRLMDRTGVMLYFDGDGHGDGDGTCKQAFSDFDGQNGSRTHCTCQWHRHCRGFLMSSLTGTFKLRVNRP